MVVHQPLDDGGGLVCGVEAEFQQVGDALELGCLEGGGGKDGVH